MDVFGHHSIEDTTLRAIALCADDFGLRPGVNEAILALVAQGRLQAVGCMVGARAWSEGARALDRVPRATVDVGLHLDFTECPLTTPPRPLGRFIAASLGRQLKAQAVRQEIDAQLLAFEQSTGAPPAFIDGHQHVHQLPGVREPLLAALRARYGRDLPWVRSTRAGGVLTPGRLKARLIERLGAAAFLREAEALGMRHNRRLLGVYDFQGDASRYLALLAEWLSVAQSGDLLMCHPGLGEDASDPIADARRVECEVLSSPDFASLIVGGGLRLQAPSRLWPRVQASREARS